MALIFLCSRAVRYVMLNLLPHFSTFVYPYPSLLVSRLRTEKADYLFVNVNVNKLLVVCFSFDFLEFGAFGIISKINFY